MFVSEEKFWVFCVFDSNLMYFYVLNFVFMFFNFVKINKLIFLIYMLMCHGCCEIFIIF